jgi:hypothetical protein
VKPEVQKHILICLSEVGNRGSVDLIKKEFAERTEFDIVMAAGKALKNLGAVSDMKLITQKTEDPEDLRVRIMKHVTDDRI